MARVDVDKVSQAGARYLCICYVCRSSRYNKVQRTTIAFNRMQKKEHTNKEKKYTEMISDYFQENSRFLLIPRFYFIFFMDARGFCFEVRCFVTLR